MSGTRFTRLACAVLAATLVVAPLAGVASGATAAGGATGTSAASSAAQDQPETADEFLAAFRSLNGSAAFEAYSEFEVIRTQAVSNVQIGEFTASDRERMTKVLNVLRSFDEAYRLAGNGSYVESLERANRTAEHVAALRDAGGQEYVALARLALDRFYRDQGEQLNERAERTNRTPDKIALLRHAATAYERAGAIERFTKLTVRADGLAAEYEADMERYNESVAAARSFLDDCGETCGGVGVGAFGQYRAAREADAATARAAALADEHNMPALADESASLREETSAAVSAYAVASAVVALVYALVVGAIAGLLATRFVTWRDDVLASRVGDIVQAGGVQ